MKRAGAVFLALAIAGAGSCKGNEEVTLVLLDPCADEPSGVSFKDASVYTEILVVKNGCPSDEDLALGKVDSVEFQGLGESDGSLPSVGDLPKGKYGFVVLAKDANCGVMGFGCTAADLENIREVRIAVRAWTSPTPCQPLTGGKCPAPKTCEEGRCVGAPSGDGGVGCELEVVAEGTLPDATGTVTGPGVVATPSGFVIGYRDYASDGAINATLATLSDSGTLGTPQSAEVASCAGKTLTDGVGMAFRETTGLLVTSLPDCGDANGAGAAFVPFDSSATIGSWSAPHAPDFSQLTIARTRSVAPAIAENEWEFHYRSVSQAGIGSIGRSIIQGSGFKANFKIEYPFVGSDPTFGMVATAASVRAFLGGGIPVEGGTATRVILNRVVPTDGEEAPPTVGELSLPGAPFAAMTAWNDKVAVGVPGTTGLTWSAVSVSTTAVSPIVDQASVGSGALSSADMVVHGDNLIIALGSSSGTIDVHRFTGANGSLGETAESTGEVTASGFTGTQMAIAAARSRVAVTWLGSGSSPGGWALLQCSE